MPLGGWNLVAAWLLVAFEVLPLIGLVIRARNLWNLDCSGPEPVTTVEPGLRAAVFIPTYNEPVEVIAPTIAAAVALEPAQSTWTTVTGPGCGNSARPTAPATCGATSTPTPRPAT